MKGWLQFSLTTCLKLQSTVNIILVYHMQVHNMRDLQTGINECIVAVQEVTGNPKTDTKLGRVGR